MLLDVSATRQPLDEIIIRATHVYAVRALFNDRRAKGLRLPGELVSRGVRNGYKRIMMHSARVAKAFQSTSAANMNRPMQLARNRNSARTHFVSGGGLVTGAHWMDNM
eukprot:140466-Karenia_brevis.AAC.1